MKKEFRLNSFVVLSHKSNKNKELNFGLSCLLPCQFLTTVVLLVKISQENVSQSGVAEHTEHIMTISVPSVL